MTTTRLPDHAALDAIADRVASIARELHDVAGDAHELDKAITWDEHRLGVPAAVEAVHQAFRDVESAVSRFRRGEHS